MPEEELTSKGIKEVKKFFLRVENENGTWGAVHNKYLHIAEKNLGMVVNMIFIKKFCHCTKQIHFWNRE